MEAIDQLATALAAAQAEMNNAAFNRINPHFKSQYADLAAIRDATIPALTANGLALVQYTRPEMDGALYLYTRLMHKSGQFIEGIYPITSGTPQAMGSQLTYAKRYCWSAMCGIAADDDDDANAAEEGAFKGKPSNKSAYRGRKEEEYPGLEKGIRDCKSTTELEAWFVTNKAKVEALPEEWKGYLHDEYGRRMSAIRYSEPASNEKSGVKKQLRASLEAEDTDVTP